MSGYTPMSQPNVGDAERMISNLLGGLLALIALRKSPGAMLMLALGGALLWRGMSGRCPFYSALDISTASSTNLPAVRITEERMVDETVEESFPASDPPSWTGGHAS